MSTQAGMTGESGMSGITDTDASTAGPETVDILLKEDGDAYLHENGNTISLEDNH